MPGSLFDTNVWVAAIFPSHPFHQTAQSNLLRATRSDPAVFCRSTHISFLRLASTPTLLKAYGAEGMTNRDAWVALDAFLALPQVTTRDEPPGLLPLWRTFAARESAAPKVWMDAYLAAFAIAGGLRMVTLDRDFNAYLSHGLDLSLLSA